MSFLTTLYFTQVQAADPQGCLESEDQEDA
jgi:hypothetical protein